MNKLVKYKYIIEGIDIMLDNENLKIQTARFQSLIIDHNYLTSIVPYIELDLILEMKEAVKIKKSKSCRIKLSISEHTINDKNHIIKKRMWMNRVFDAQFITETVDPGEVKVEKPIPKGQHLQPGSFILFSQEDLNFLNTEKDFIFTDVSSFDVLASFLLERNSKKNVIASPADVNKRNKKCQIPMGNLMKNIDFLTKNYGIYTTRPTVYKDIDRLYILNMNTIPIDIPNELNTVSIVLKDPTTDGPITHPVNTESKESYQIIYPKQGIVKESLTTKFKSQVTPENVISVDKTGKLITYSKDKNSTKVKFVRNQHGVSGKLATHHIESSDGQLLELTNVCIDFFKPYKRFIIMDSPVKGDHYLVRATVHLNGVVLKDPSTEAIQPTVKAYIQKK